MFVSNAEASERATRRGNEGASERTRERASDGASERARGRARGRVSERASVRGNTSQGLKTPQRKHKQSQIGNNRVPFMDEQGSY